MSQAGIIQLPFTESSATNVDFNFIGWIKNNFGGLATTIEDKRIITHDDILPFSFASLDQIKKDFEKAGYSPDEVKREIEALAEIPQYAKKSHRNKRG